MTTERDQVARELADKLDLRLEDGGWAIDRAWDYLPRPVWDALISKEMECRKLREALDNLHNAVEARADSGKRRSLTVSPKMEDALMMAQAVLKAGV